MSLRGAFKVLSLPRTYETQYRIKVKAYRDIPLRGYTIKVRPTRVYQSGPSGPLKDQARMGDTCLVLGGKQEDLQVLPAHKGER